MSESAPAVAAAPAPVAAPAPAGELTISEAENIVRAWKTDGSTPPDESAGTDPPAGDEELAKADADRPQDDPGEKQSEEAEPADDLPPIERPRSWTKDLDDEWQSLPRALQEKVAAREQERDTGLRRSQNEAAEKAKAIEAERQKLIQAQKEYEAKLPALIEMMRNAQEQSFADVKTVDDAIRLSQEDPFRYLQFQAHQQKLQAVAYENEQAKQRESQLHQANWQQHVAEQNAKIAELLPDLFADETKSVATQKRAAELLEKDLGFTRSELTRLASGEEKLSLYDHRLQLLIANTLKLQDIQKAPKAVAARPVPPVQRPGVSKPAGAETSERIQELENRLNRTGSEKDAWALMEAKMAAKARRR